MDGASCLTAGAGPPGFRKSVVSHTSFRVMQLRHLGRLASQRTLRARQRLQATERRRRLAPLWWTWLSAMLSIGLEPDRAEFWSVDMMWEKYNGYRWASTYRKPKPFHSKPAVCRKCKYGNCKEEVRTLCRTEPIGPKAEGGVQHWDVFSPQICNARGEKKAAKWGFGSRPHSW